MPGMDLGMWGQRAEPGKAWALGALTVVRSHLPQGPLWIPGCQTPPRRKRARGSPLAGGAEEGR